MAHARVSGADATGRPQTETAQRESQEPFVTTDPARDTAVVLRRWLDNFDRHFVGLTGTEAALEMIQKTAGVPVAQRSDASNGRYSVAHANFVLAYTKDNLAHVIYPGGVGKDDWVHDLPLLVQESWAHDRGDQKSRLPRGLVTDRSQKLEGL